MSVSSQADCTGGGVSVCSQADCTGGGVSVCSTRQGME